MTMVAHLPLLFALAQPAPPVVLAQGVFDMGALTNSLAAGGAARAAAAQQQRRLAAQRRAGVAGQPAAGKPGRPLPTGKP